MSFFSSLLHFLDCDSGRRPDSSKVGPEARICGHVTYSGQGQQSRKWEAATPGCPATSAHPADKSRVKVGPCLLSEQGTWAFIFLPRQLLLKPSTPCHGNVTSRHLREHKHRSTSPAACGQSRHRGCHQKSSSRTSGLRHPRTNGATETWTEHPQWPLQCATWSGTLGHCCPAGALLNQALPRTGD